jgi:UDP-glucose 4-epimerase
LKIGITGWTGFLGSYLLNYLTNKYETDLFYVVTRKKPAKLPNVRLIPIIGDLTDERVCNEFINKDLDVIIWLAHNFTPLTSNNNLVADVNLNVIPILNVLNLIQKIGKKIYVIYVSSGGAIYGISKNKEPFKETDPIEPISSYGIQKMVAENYLRMFAFQGFIDVTILRISNPYGVLLPVKRQQGLIGVVLNKILKGEEIDIFGNIHNVRDYLHLQDMCRAFNICLHNKQNGYECFNIGSGIGTSVKAILKLLEEISRKEIKYKIIQMNNADYLPSWNVLNIDKAKNLLLWEPEINLKEGLEHMYNRYYQ